MSPPFTMPAQTLTDTGGKPYRLNEETAGSVTLLYFGYTNCPDVCPTHFAEITQALKRVPETVRDRVKVVFVTSDPERDTLEAMRTWLDQFDPNYVGLRPDAGELAALLQDFNIPEPEHEHLVSGTEVVAHASFVIAFSADGTGGQIYPEGTRAEDWQHDLPLLVAEGAR